MRRITVITCSIPERAGMLAECVASVNAQTLRPVQHLIHVDHERAGIVYGMNCLLAGARGEWLAWLADDDLMDPDHLETLAGNADGADIVYSWPRVEGEDFDLRVPFDPVRLREANHIAATALIRTSLVHRLGGWKETAHGCEDWDLWVRALDAGARFRLVERVTWTYRFHGANLSRGQL